MNNIFKSWRNGRRLQRCEVRQAVPEDLDFVIEQLVEGAQDGHYLDAMLAPENQAKYRAMFLALMRAEGTAMFGERGLERRSGSLWIYGNNQEGSIGFFYLIEKYQGSGENEIELLMAGIKNGARRIGHGANMVSRVITLIPKHATLYARCYPASEAMYKSLVNAGFLLLNVKPGGTRELERKGT